MAAISNDPGALEAPPEVAGYSPGLRLSTRVLIVTDNEGAQDAHQLFVALDSVGLRVAVAGLQEWQFSGGHDSHDVILLNVVDDLKLALALCQAVKKDEYFADTSILVRLDTEMLADPSQQQLWKEMRSSGADDIIPLRAYLPEIEARLDALATKTHLARELRDAQAELHRHLQFDEVTQLLNRRFFFKAAHRETARARRYNHSLSCLMVDVDYLVLYNQNFGFNCGDYILRTIANILRQWTRDSDILARFTGTKFVLLLPETNVQGALVSRDKLQQMIGEINFAWQSQTLPVTVSIGEADRRFERTREPASRSTDEEDEEIELISVREELAELLADADAALYVAKKGAHYPAICVDNVPGLVSIPAVA